MSKYIFVTGGVVSSLGKGIIAASLGRLLVERGFKVTIQKLDPYLNVDPGTMSPYEHGECYVTRDGAETDLDLGHYERFLNVQTSQANNLTTGKVYYQVIKDEREGKYLGKTVQVVPHITEEIKRNIRILGNSNEYNIVIVELGGTVGDIESLPYIESVRQLIWEEGKENVVCIHLALLPYLTSSSELKTKPAQHSVKRLSEQGIAPDILVCRTEKPLNKTTKEKLALHCNIKPEAVIEAKNAKSIYDVPNNIMKEGIDKIALKLLNIEYTDKPILKKWNELVGKIKKNAFEIHIGLVGKYTSLPDAYKSILESLSHAGMYSDVKPIPHFISSDNNGVSFDENMEKLKEVDGMIVLPGFGDRGFEGKVKMTQYARENQIPFLGICLGLQVAVIEFARNVLNLSGANSTEMDENCSEPVIFKMEEQKKTNQKGGTMRLGSYPCEIKDETSLAYQIYQERFLSERHRHRFEFNNTYLSLFEQNGFIASGTNPEQGLVEVMELTKHPFYLCTQYHPEYESTFENPHPIFIHLLKTIKKIKSI